METKDVALFKFFKNEKGLVHLGSDKDEKCLCGYIPRVYRFYGSFLALPEEYESIVALNNSDAFDKEFDIQDHICKKCLNKVKLFI